MNFVYYRLPHTQQVFRGVMRKEPEELASLAELNGRRGFVIAPFAPSDDCPILLLDVEWEPMELPADTMAEASLVDADFAKEQESYAIDFENFHAQLCDGTFSKIVLARSARLTATEDVSPLTLFARACRRYPRMFVALFSTERSGTWLVATPEVLVRGRRDEMRTMALAGTMRLTEDQLSFDTEGGSVSEADIHWSTKNRQEQHYVETYITECVEHFSDDFSVKGPSTARAGDLVHLRSDITFKPYSMDVLGNLLNALHPTPAVCGIPKEESRDFILRNESLPRLYYSGFSGILNPDGETSLFVTLRCMRMEDVSDENASPRRFTLYAGGGLLKESSCQTEWDETEAKMNTMRQTFKK